MNSKETLKRNNNESQQILASEEQRDFQAPVENMAFVENKNVRGIGGLPEFNYQEGFLFGSLKKEIEGSAKVGPLTERMQKKAGWIFAASLINTILSLNIAGIAGTIGFAGFLGFWSVPITLTIGVVWLALGAINIFSRMYNKSVRDEYNEKMNENGLN